jgi:hypothetical protein
MLMAQLPALQQNAATIFDAILTSLTVTLRTPLWLASRWEDPSQRPSKAQGSLDTLLRALVVSPWMT